MMAMLDGSSSPRSRCLLIGHGSSHSVREHHMCYRDACVRGAAHTLDVDRVCRPTFVADAGCARSCRGVPSGSYDKVVTMHVPCGAWLHVVPGRASGRPCLRKQFFLNVHRWLRRGGRFYLEFPALALFHLSRCGFRGLYRGARDKQTLVTEGIVTRACEEAAEKVSSLSVSRGSARMFYLHRVEAGWCVLVKT